MWTEFVFNHTLFKAASLYTQSIFNSSSARTEHLIHWLLFPWRQRSVLFSHTKLFEATVQFGLLTQETPTERRKYRKEARVEKLQSAEVHFWEISSNLGSRRHKREMLVVITSAVQANSTPSPPHTHSRLFWLQTKLPPDNAGVLPHD